MYESVLIFSDTHGAILPSRLLSLAEECDQIIFLGDGISGLGSLLCKSNLHAVAGNCDRVLPSFKREEVLEIAGARILITHGDRYRVKQDLTALYLRACELNCKAALYGHTHASNLETHNGVLLLCPGSPCYPVGPAPTYAYMSIKDGEIIANIVPLY